MAILGNFVNMFSGNHHLRNIEAILQHPILVRLISSIRNG